jgi:hypothetical protein
VTACRLFKKPAVKAAIDRKIEAVWARSARRSKLDLDVRRTVARDRSRCGYRRSRTPFRPRAVWSS